MKTYWLLTIGASSSHCRYAIVGVALQGSNDLVAFVSDLEHFHYVGDPLSTDSGGSSGQEQTHCGIFTTYLKPSTYALVLRRLHAERGWREIKYEKLHT